MSGAWQRQKAFLAAFLLGTLVVVGVRESLPGLDGAIWAASGCAVIIVGWAFLCYRQDAAAAFQAADDFYYLGLLFTLVSLIHVLVRIFVLGDTDGEQRAQQIIGNFGIALVSTVVGIVARVVLLGTGTSLQPPDTGTGQGQPTGTGTPDRDTVVEEDIVGLRDQIRQAVDALSHFTRVTLAQAHDTKAHTERLIGEFNDRVDVHARERLSALDDVASSWEHGTRTIQKQMDDLAEKADGRLAVAVSRADQAWQRIAAHAEQASEDVRRRTEAASEEFSTMLREIGDLRRVLSPLTLELAAAGRSAVGLTEGLEATSSRLADVTDGIRSAATEMQSVQGNATVELSGLVAAIASLQAAASPLGELTTTAAASMRTLDEATNDAVARTRLVGTTLGRANDSLVGVVEAITTGGAKLDASVVSMATLEERLKRLGESAMAASTGLDARAREIVDAHHALADGTEQHLEQILEQLRRQAKSWSEAIDALEDSIRRHQTLVEQSATANAELLRDVERERGSGQRWFGIGSRRP